MKFLPTLLFSLSILIIPLSSQQQTLSLEHAVSQDVNKQLLCMAKNIYYEAASESFEGKLALHDTIYRTKSMFYHNTSVNPAWKLKYVAKIGNHLFYTKA